MKLIIILALCFFLGYQTGASETLGKLLEIQKNQILEMSHMMPDETDTKWSTRKAIKNSIL